MRVRKDQKGFTIVELLIAIAILSIVVASVCGFILVGSRSYATANSDINVQQSAQLALNQMSDVLIDTTRSVNYTGYAGSSSQNALKDAEFTFAPESKSLVMINGVVEEDPSGGPDILKDGNGNKHYYFYWSKEKETLFYAELDVTSDVVKYDDILDDFPDIADADPNADPSATRWYVLATHVTDFSVDLTQVEEKRVVMLALTFVDGRKEYVTSNNVTIRNKVRVNDAELDPLNKKKTLSVTPRDAGVILEPGEEYHFSTPKVTGENVADRSVTWKVLPDGHTPDGTVFTDDANGILQVNINEPAGTIDIMITTNAVDSDGNHASCTMTVYIKRVRAVSLSKTADADADNGANEVSVGNEFTISALVEGEKLGVQCSGCTADITHDFDVVDWRVTQGAEFLDIIETGDCKKDTKYCVKAGTAVGTVIKIAATSELSKNRLYPEVIGEITLTVAKSKETAEPYKGKLKYGVSDLHESVRAGLPTDFGKYVTAIRVVNNTKNEPDRILLHYTTGGGANYRISPDLFDLDLNQSYTFYMQAIFPIPEERYVPGHGGTEDDNATIWNEYYGNIKNNTASEGYTGKRYRHGKVFYAKLDKPKLTYSYKGVEYTGKNITYDPVNIYTVGLGSGIVGEIRPIKYENIVEDNSVWNKIANSLYEGEGSSLSGWNKVYYADKDSIIVHKDDQGKESYSLGYHGKNTLADGAVQIDPRGSMFLKLNSDNNKEKACGMYHIVPGMVYKNEDPGCFEIIGYDGFEFSELKREARYYEFDDSTIHVEITDEFTMEIKHPDFTGQAMFPLPKQMVKDPLFPNIYSLKEQRTGAKLTVKAKRDSNSGTEDLAFSYVNYRYIEKDKAWEVEPVRLEYTAGAERIKVHSYGIYKCGENDKKWWCTKAGGTTEMDFTIKRFDFNSSSYRAYFPLPSETGFPFADGTGETTCELELYDSNMQAANNVPKFTVSGRKTGDEYEITFRTERREDPYNSNNHKVIVQYYGTYTWREGQKEWTWKSGYRTDVTTDLTLNLKDLKVNGTSCMAYFPLPTESGFPFAGGAGETKRTVELYDSNYQRVTNNVPESFIVSGEKTGDAYEITFRTEEKVQNSYKVKVTYYGTYTWGPGQVEWTQTKGSSVEYTTDLVTNLANLELNNDLYMMYFPLPTESSFPFKNGVTEWSCNLDAYKVTDIYGEQRTNLSWHGVNVKYTQSGNVHTITFVKYEWWGTNELGTFECTDGATSWTKKP